MTAFPDLHVAMDKLIVENGSVEYHWTLTGANNGPGGTGNPVRISGYESWQIGPNGLIASSQGYFDAEEYRRQIEGFAQHRAQLSAKTIARLSSLRSCRTPPSRPHVSSPARLDLHTVFHR